MQNAKASPKRASQSGASLIEAAFALPVVLSLVFGVIQWGLILAANAALYNAAATGARLLSTSNPPGACSGYTSAAVTAAGPYLDTAAVTCVATTSAGATCTGIPPAGNITITCNYTLNLLLPFVVPGNVNGQRALSAAVTGR